MKRKRICRNFISLRSTNYIATTRREKKKTNCGCILTAMKAWRFAFSEESCGRQSQVSRDVSVGTRSFCTFLSVVVLPSFSQLPKGFLEASRSPLSCLFCRICPRWCLVVFFGRLMPCEANGAGGAGAAWRTLGQLHFSRFPQHRFLTLRTSDRNIPVSNVACQVPELVAKFNMKTSRSPVRKLSQRNVK